MIMTVIVDIKELRFDTVDTLVVEAFVTEFSSNEDANASGWETTLCRGTMYFPDDALIPATDAELKQLLEDSIDDWEPILYA